MNVLNSTTRKPIAVAPNATEYENVDENEFYPELLAVIVNYLFKYELHMLEESEDAAAMFTSFVQQTLFHISKHSSLQIVLEELGWYLPDLKFSDILAELRETLNELYLEQIKQCIPLTVCLGSELKVENHPDLFNDQIAMYSYLPNILLNNLLKESKSSSYSATSSSLKFEGACMLADISGFTKLSGACCEEGTSGLDRLHDACSGYLGKFVQTVYTYQGDGKYTYWA